VIEGAAWHRHSARFDSFAGANSDGQSSGNRLVNVTTPSLLEYENMPPRRRGTPAASSSSRG
jgi:hypothetical protein